LRTELTDPARCRRCSLRKNGLAAIARSAARPVGAL